jgi:ABC-type transport system involved in multi-copper enzyme maturation permease subunit
MILKLVRKDLLLSWTMLLWVAGIVAGNALLYSYEDASPALVAAFGLLVAGFLPLMISGREDRYRTNAFGCSLPVTRRQVVLSRYLAGIAPLPLWYGISLLASWFASGGRLPPEFLRLDTAVTACSTAVLAMALLHPFILVFGFVGFLVALVVLQAIAVLLVVVGPTLGLKGGLLAIEQVLRRIGPALRGLRATFGDPAYFLLALAALGGFLAASIALSIGLLRRKDL